MSISVRSFVTALTAHNFLSGSPGSWHLWVSCGLTAERFLGCVLWRRKPARLFHLWALGGSSGLWGDQWWAVMGEDLTYSQCGVGYNLLTPEGLLNIIIRNYCAFITHTQSPCCRCRRNVAVRGLWWGCWWCTWITLSYFSTSRCCSSVGSSVDYHL